MEADFNPLSFYEQEQLVLIEQWKKESPGMANHLTSTVLKPVTWIAEKIIPQSAIKGALDFANLVGKLLADESDLKRDACVRSISELKQKDLALSDRLANKVHNWGIGMAGGEGGLTGAAGAIGIAADVPAIITLALRTIHKIGLCYGYEAKTKGDQEFIFGIMSASGANSIQEKQAALALLRKIQIHVMNNTFDQLVKEQFGGQTTLITTKVLANQLGINLTKRKALQVIPALGALVGASVNGWYIKEVGWAARRSYQEKWLIDNHKIPEVQDGVH